MTIQTVKGGGGSTSDAPSGAIVFSGGAQGYTTFNSPTAADVNTTVKNMAYVAQTDTNANKLCGYLISIGSITPPYTYTIKIRDCYLGDHVGSFNTSAALYVLDGNTTGKTLSWRIENNNAPWNMNAATWNDWATFSGGLNSSVTYKTGGPYYLRAVVHAANNIDIYFSSAGQAFSRPGTFATGINFLSNATYVGFGPLTFQGDSTLLVEWAWLVAGVRSNLL